MPKSSSLTHVIVRGAREHNLQNINLEIPKNKLVVFTGLSGSGKSSLAFDTLYAEGQRRYVESLSSYARQFLGGMHKPAVDQIEGLSPAISIDQKTTSHNPRSTVGTITEIYDYLRLLFARIGHPHCPECGQEISTQSVDQILQQILTELESRAQASPARVMILAPVVRNRKGEFSALFKNLQKKGYSRLRIDGQVYDIADDITLIKTNKHNIEVLIDRLTISRQQLRDDQERKTLLSRLSQSIEEALKLADGLIIASFVKDKSFNFPDNPQDYENRLFSEALACSDCGISIKELEPRFFSFNSPEGACETCNGLGSIEKIDEEKVVAPELTLSEGAIIPFARMLSYDSWMGRMASTVVEEAGFDFRQTAFQDLSPEVQKMVLYGTDKIYEFRGENRLGKITSFRDKFEGFITNLERRYEQTDSEYMRKEIVQYMRKEICQACQGRRLKPQALAVTIQRMNIADITELTIQRSLAWSKKLQASQDLSDKEKIISQPILKEIVSRLEFLASVGLNYLTLSREASTLAGGEAQRIRLASQIGTGLTGVLYILDEPTIGLHQRDNQQLVNTLQNLRDKGNTVIVVEHDQAVMQAADHIIDFGPLAGKQGGKIVATGTLAEIKKNPKSLTGQYLKGNKSVIRNNTKASQLTQAQKNHANLAGQKLSIRKANHHNLQGIDVDFPLSQLICITGISGSGKSTLLYDTLYLNMAEKLGKRINQQLGSVEQITFPPEIKKASLIDQSPIGRTPRSNPATYTKIFDYIRKIFTNTKEAQIRGYKPGRFSFNVKGGRCESCQGEGQIKIEMQFLPDVYVTCDVCHGKRYNHETLQVTYKDKNIAQVLNMPISEAYEFFSNHSTMRHKLKTLIDVGLGYLELGQPAPTLSGGESQRVKLAKELSIRSYDHVVYLLDEPTTGLHFADVQKLLNVLHQLVAQGNTVIVIEHNMDIIKNADWIIDLGPEGGEYGGEIVAIGTPEQIAENKNSFTGSYLKEEL